MVRETIRSPRKAYTEADRRKKKKKDTEQLRCIRFLHISGGQFSLNQLNSQWCERWALVRQPADSTWNGLSNSRASENQQGTGRWASFLGGKAKATWSQRQATGLSTGSLRSALPTNDNDAPRESAEQNSRQQQGRKYLWNLYHKYWRLINTNIYWMPARCPVLFSFPAIQEDGIGPTFRVNKRRLCSKSHCTGFKGRCVQFQTQILLNRASFVLSRKYETLRLSSTNVTAWERVFRRSVNKVIADLWIKSWSWAQFMPLTSQEARGSEGRPGVKGERSDFGVSIFASSFLCSRNLADALVRIFSGRSSQCSQVSLLIRTTLQTSFQAGSPVPQTMWVTC